jgi:hypothetical protein
MRKPIVLSVMIALVLLAGSISTPAYSQAPSPSDTPTFYHLVPGAYVNPWPRFTITYPKDWVEVPYMVAAGEVFKVASPGPLASRGSLTVAVFPFPPPLERFADRVTGLLRKIATEVTVVSDKPVQLPDGTPAREVELHMLLNRALLYLSYLTTTKGNVGVSAFVAARETIGGDLKTILYSLEFQPDRDKPVEVPPDVQAFLDKMNSDLISHDLAKVMSGYSDRFLDSGMRKGGMELWWRPVIGQITSMQTSITDFVPAGDRAYLAGFWTPLGTGMLIGSSIIKENGEWKWFGNQRNVAPDPSPPPR